MLAIIKDTSIYTIGDVFTKGIGFFAIVFYTHFLSQDEMGVYGYILVIISFFSAFLILGADNAYARYFFEYKSKKEKQLLTTTLFIFFSIWTVVALILPLIFVDDISFFLLDTKKHSLVFFLAFLSLPLKLISSLSNQALRNQFKTKQFIIYNFFTAFVTIVGAIFLLKFTSLGIGSIFLGMIIADILVLPFRIYAIKDLFVLSVDFSLLKKILAYGVPFLPATIAYWIFSSADRVMLESMSGLDSVGIYTVAVTLGGIMSILASAIGQAWSPHAVKTYEDDKESARKLYKRFLNVLITLVLFVLFCASMLGKEIIIFLFPEEYKSAFYPMLLLLIGIGFKITGQVTAAGIGLAKKTIYLVYITFFVAIVNIILNYLLIPLYSEIGASIATMFSFLLLTVLYSFTSQKLFKIEYDKRYIVWSFLILVMVVLGSFLDSVVRFVMFGLVLVGIYYKKNRIIEAVR